MMLDTYSEVFVWIGRGANELEKKEGLKTAQEYIRTDPSDRDLDSTTLIQVCVETNVHNMITCTVNLQLPDLGEARL